MSLQKITELCLNVGALIMTVLVDIVHVIKHVLCACQLHGYNIMQTKWSTWYKYLISRCQTNDEVKLCDVIICAVMSSYLNRG